MTTDNPSFIKGVVPNLLPITYEKMSAPKEIISYTACTKADLSSFDTEIGVITNYSTSLYALEAKHTEKKLKEVQTRLKILRREQGNQIDKAKGVQIAGFPEHWIKWSKIDHINDTMEVKINKDFNNDILIEKKPYFMVYVYPQLFKQVKKWFDNMKTYSLKVFDCSLDELEQKENKTEDELKFLSSYYKFMPVDRTPCTMNRICFHMEKEITFIREYLQEHKQDTTDILINHNIEWSKGNFVKIQRIYKRMIEEQRFSQEVKQLDKQKMIEYFNNVCPESEWINYCAKLGGSNFVWSLGSDMLITNIYNNRQEKILVPVESDDGEIMYLNKRYKEKLLDERTEISL